MNDQQETIPTIKLKHSLTTEESALISLEVALTDFVKKFHTSATRWERMVYPSMFIFGILGLSGFWLIASLTRDMHSMTNYIDPLMAENLATMSQSMRAMTRSVINMDKQVSRMADKMENMDKHMSIISDTITSMQTHTELVSKQLDTLRPLLLNIAEMNHAMKTMTANTAIMSRDVNAMGRPMSFMQGFMPW
jgi:hypothetical protein